MVVHVRDNLACDPGVADSTNCATTNATALHPTDHPGGVLARKPSHRRPPCPVPVSDRPLAGLFR